MTDPLPNLAVASRYRLTFGPYQGQCLSTIAKTPEGVAYLKFVKAQRALDRFAMVMPVRRSAVDNALQCYLRHIDTHKKAHTT